MRDLKSTKRIVIKIGSSSLTYPDTHKLNLDKIDLLAREISDLFNSGREVVLVSSGAIASGMARLNFDTKPKELGLKQTLACVGQSTLMQIYNRCFSEYGYTCGQLLLTKYVIDNENMRNNAKNCINQMLSMHILPIINENDSISVDEIKLGDNDNLSQIVAKIIDADLLILLSDVDGVYNKNPKIHTDAQIIDEFEKNISIEADGKSDLGTGGIATKIQACLDASNAGINAIIANANENFVVRQILNNKNIGTLFKAVDNKKM